jgi:uncharacterized protein YqgQ
MFKNFVIIYFGDKMMQYYDVQQLLKRFGTFIYTGSRLADIELMMEEVKELYDAKLLDVEQFKEIFLALQLEMQKEIKKGSGE